MTEPSEHARRAAEEICDIYLPGKWNAGEDPRRQVIAKHIQSAIDAATAELSRWVLDGREVAFDLLSYDPCSCKHPACKRCRRQQAANKLIEATNGFVPPPIHPEQKEKE